jgi:hypothetical protein
MLSNNQYFYLTSQLDKLSPAFNKPQDRKRIGITVQKAFKTFDIIMNSKAMDQKQKNKYFSQEMVSGFLHHLIFYDASNSLSEENHKQSIAHRMISSGLSYYEQRYAKAAFFSQKIKEVRQLLEGLESLTRVEEQEDKAMQFYRMRKKFEVPPRLKPVPYKWQAICMICWNYTAGNNKLESMKSIRHDIKCPYKAVRGDLEWVLKTIPPLRIRKAS